MNRLHRIYASIHAVTELDMSKLPGRIIQTDKITHVEQDFSGDLSKHDLENAAQLMIANTASLKDHLKKWARQNDKNADVVDQRLTQSKEMKIVIDLWDKDKHGGDRRDGGYSKSSPSLFDIRREMVLSTQPKTGSWIAMTLGASGEPVIHGDGTSTLVINAEIKDKNNQLLGYLHDVLKECLRIWESLIKQYGITLNPS